MKKLSKEEFIDRILAIERARHIFIESGLTKNISTAFELYQEIFATRERQLSIESSGYNNLANVESYLNELCPTGCGGQIRQMKPCCGSPNGYKECAKCHYKIG